jgi:hypothetical protein
MSSFLFIININISFNYSSMNEEELRITSLHASIFVLNFKSMIVWMEGETATQRILLKGLNAPALGRPGSCNNWEKGLDAWIDHALGVVMVECVPLGGCRLGSGGRRMAWSMVGRRHTERQAPLLCAYLSSTGPKYRVCRGIPCSYALSFLRGSLVESL